MTTKEQVLTRYEVLFGFNTKQWWVYDNYTDKYTDIPMEVLEQVRKAGTMEEQQNMLIEIIMEQPSWFDDVAYQYSNIEV